MAGDAANALKQWEAENAVETVDSVDQVYKYSAADHQAVLQAKPWATDPNYFKYVRVSAIALLKMVMHARSGGDLEIMGMMQGKVVGNTMFIMDAFALPVEGTETRVNAQAEAYEYMVEYLDLAKQGGRLENAVGWYHSHPGYGCWLSGIDVSTQALNQQFQDPFVAVVIDPKRTAAAGKIEIGAFRTYPEGYKASNEPSEYQTIPQHKIEDFGVHVQKYYPLQVSYFKSRLDTNLLDLLWNKYWVNTLSSTPMLANRDYSTLQIADLGEKLEHAEGQITRLSRSSYVHSSDKKEDPLAKIAADSQKAASEHTHGMISQVIKYHLFNSIGRGSSTVPASDPMESEPT